MGNGRRSGQIQTKISTNSGTGLLWLRALGAMVVLMIAGSILLGLGSGRKAQKALAANPASPIPAFSRSSLSSLQSKPEARAILNRMLEESQQGYLPPARIADAYLGVDELEKALVWIDKAIEPRGFRPAWLQVDPRYSRLASLPQAQPLLRKTHLIP